MTSLSFLWHNKTIKNFSGDIMCTAITYKTSDTYFGRTLDHEYSYNETVTVTPRSFRFDFRRKESIKKHYAIIGMATVENNYPLYYDAANECGLGMAALNFPGNAYYFDKKKDKDNISPFEFIPWILCQCRNLDEARILLEKINLCNINFSKDMPLSPLHWIIADKEKAITVETVAEGLIIYENPIGVLTNNPTFDYHMTYLCDFANLTSSSHENNFGDIDLTPYSRGIGAKGLPGDLSSTSRFVRAAFTKLNSISGESEEESISQFFHILGSVNQTRGCVRLEGGKNMITEYTSCINLEKGIYYYTTYGNNCISSVDMTRCNLENDELFIFPLVKEQIINKHN